MIFQEYNLVFRKNLVNNEEFESLARAIPYFMNHLLQISEDYHFSDRYLNFEAGDFIQDQARLEMMDPICSL